MGSGGGFSDLEYALARALSLVDSSTPVVTTVDTSQVVVEGIPMTRHDLALNYIGTAGGVIACRPSYLRPEGIDWDELGKKLEEVPI